MFYYVGVYITYCWYADDRSVRVHGDVARGIFTGEIRTGQDSYYIEPSSRLVNVLTHETI